MRALVRRSHTPGDAHVDEVALPPVGPGEVVVRVAACGLCGSDIHAVRADPGFEFVKVPVVLGHEWSGVVEESGAEVDGIVPGDAVVAISIQGCHRCATCLAGDTHLCPQRNILGLHVDGGAAERAVISARHLVGVPAGLGLTTAALAEPLAVAVHAVLDRSRVVPGDRVVVSGPGPIGLFSGRLAALSGAQVLVLGTPADAAQRLPLAERFGLRTAVLGPQASVAEAIAQAWGGSPPDTWIEASGAVVALAAATGAVRAGGQVTVVALFSRPYELLVTDAVRRELSLHFSYAARRQEYVTALDLLASGAVEGAALATTFPLPSAREALAAGEEQRVVKPLLVMATS